MDLIICTWTAKLPEGCFVVWPDGCRDLIAIASKSDPLTILCSGLDTGPRQVVCYEDTFFVGVRLAVGVTFSWERDGPCSKHDDQVLSQIPLFGCHEWKSENDGGETLEMLVSVVNNFANPPPSWVSEYIQDVRGGEVRRAMPLSERSIRRKLADTSGAPPRYWKSLARVRQAALDVVQSETPLVFIAVKHGFSDQAHLSREIRRWFGVTPVTLRTNREQCIERLSAPDVFLSV